MAPRRLARLLALGLLSVVSMAGGGGKAMAQVAAVTNDWVTLRPPGAGFRILMPPDWETSTPRGANIRVLFRAKQPAPSGRPGVANCNVGVRAEASLRGFTQAELDADMRANPMTEEDARAATLGLAIREKRLGRVSNRPAFIVVASGEYETVAARTQVVVMTALLSFPGRAMAATCTVGAPTAREAELAWTAWRPVVLAVLGTLVIEDWQ